MRVWVRLGVYASQPSTCRRLGVYVSQSLCLYKRGWCLSILSFQQTSVRMRVIISVRMRMRVRMSTSVNIRVWVGMRIKVRTRMKMRMKPPKLFEKMLG
jgi:hypothetical protein